MIYPMLALVLLTLVVLIINLIYRIVAVRQGQVEPKYFKTFQGEAPSKVVAASRNYSNLFEMTVLFYVASILAIVINAETVAIISLAWLYVLCRTIHSAIHLTSNHVYARLAAFASSTAILAGMWVILAVQVITH